MRYYTKSHATPTDRVAHLKSKGLVIKRPDVAARKIESIGYERLRIYFLSRRDGPNKTFRPGTNYNDNLQLYNCDVRLRVVIFESVGRFELAFRNILSETLSKNYGPHPYYDQTAFKNPKAQDEALRDVIGIFLKSRDDRAKHYRRSYDSPALPPVWTYKEFLTFGSAARLYGKLSNKNKDEIAKRFGLPGFTVMDSWLPCFVDIRNVCAHHDRLFNRRFQKLPKRLVCAHVPTVDGNLLKAQVETLDYVLKAIGEDAQTTEKVEAIIRQQQYAAVVPSEAGF